MAKFDGDSYINQFEQACNQIHTEVDSKRKNGMLYKYTSYEGLEAIIKTRKLRYTDYRFFNDPTEILFGKNIIKKTLSSSAIPTINKDLFLTLINRIFDSFDEFYHMYVGCFSTSINKLSLWRYYACNGAGFAIAFNENFQKISPPAESNLGKAVICQVIYDEAEAKKIINKFIDEYLKSLSSAKMSLNQNDKDAFIEFIKNLDSRLACNLVSFLPGFKDESFADEDEVRMFYTEGKGMIHPDTGKPFYFDDSVRDFIPITNQPHPFAHNLEGNKPVILPDEFSIDDISEIWIGPCCEFIAARTAIRNLLLDSGYHINNIEIIQAKLPYQNR